MTLVEFINNNDVDYTFNRIPEEKIDELESKIGVSFGEQLKKYVLEYGYLGYKHIELFGVNNSEVTNSDMIKKTLRLHTRFEKTKDLIAVEDQGDGDYYLVDSDDRIYRFIAPNNELIPMNIDLFEYILKRFCAAN